LIRIYSIPHGINHICKHAYGYKGEANDGLLDYLKDLEAIRIGNLQNKEG